MNIQQAREIVRDKLPDDEIFAQMAEDCAELGKAALKMRRVRTGINPTVINEIFAKENLLQGCGDVLSCAQMLLSREELQRVFDIAVSKTMRWAFCLQERDEKNETE
jgi:hypothetical protein